MCAEIELEMRRIYERGGKIQKFSMIEYSLGGLKLRYTLGLLHAKGTLDDIECMNFITFATPHVGARRSVRACFDQIWNMAGARNLGVTGRQMFLIDTFRGTGRTLLSVLADPNSVFVDGLRRFKRCSVYGSITNDKITPYYSTNIRNTDPYADLDKLDLRGLEGYDKVILDPFSPFTRRSKKHRSATLRYRLKEAQRFLQEVLWLLYVYCVFVPIGLSVFLFKGAIINTLSARHIKTHDTGKTIPNIAEYRRPLWAEDLQNEMCQMVGSLNTIPEQEDMTSSDSDGDITVKNRPRIAVESILGQPTLGLRPVQVRMIDNLDTLGGEDGRVLSRMMLQFMEPLLPKGLTSAALRGSRFLDISSKSS